MEFDKNKIKTKIAISKIKEESDIVMKKKTKSVFKTVVTAIAGKPQKKYNFLLAILKKLQKKAKKRIYLKKRLKKLQ